MPQGGFQGRAIRSVSASIDAQPFFVMFVPPVMRFTGIGPHGQKTGRMSKYKCRQAAEGLMLSTQYNGSDTKTMPDIALHSSNAEVFSNPIEFNALVVQTGNNPIPSGG
jgi:hypothetical protein